VYYVILFALAGAMTYLNWGLVHAAPHSLSMLLPAKYANLIGAALLIVGLFTAVFSAYALHSPPGVLESSIQAFAGLWFILATTSANRGSYEDEQMLRRLFAMAGLLQVVLLLTSLTHDTREMAVLSLALVTGGFWVTANFIRYLERDTRGR